MRPETLKIEGRYILESGRHLTDPVIAYHTFGELNARKDNVVWVCHALTANSNVYEWWPGLFGPTDLFNDQDYFIVCANMLGSHYGTTGPLHMNPDTGTKYYHDFPEITIRDMVGLHRRLADHLGIEKIHLVLGGSMGGQQALEWIIMEPYRFVHAALIATNAVHSPWGVAFNESQRMAIESDVTWKLRQDDAGLEGMKAARSVALLSYRNYGTYFHAQQPTNDQLTYPDRAPSYQRYQGLKLARRFNAFSYWHLSKAMDSHNIGRGRQSIEWALDKIEARVLALTLERDILFPESEQKRLCAGIRNATHQVIRSTYGHDGFLIETEKLSSQFRMFLQPVKA